MANDPELICRSSLHATRPHGIASNTTEVISLTQDAVTPVLAWVPLLGGDPLPWLLASDEPAARWVTLTGVLDRPDHDPEVTATRAAVVADPGTGELMGRLPDWQADQRLSGHNSPRFAPNLLNLLADMGVREGDHPRVGRLLEQLLAHQDPPAGSRPMGHPAPVRCRCGGRCCATATRSSRCWSATVAATIPGSRPGWPGWRPT